ncbi:methyltransferase type 11 [Shewanella sediminis HAW-EB3]|uniref:Methyltransferase type 11 n=1 Tax=Shewanella sediminis (strain HAW-EB3) TaxID=425104 RepID=A8FY08_SHESH|nr:class I SAM-dependent methyltransferase [Shewanella sediminis]ABV37731.1 methyltransferase type 11 [Shewanella sediminis HAW-EB3]
MKARESGMPEEDSWASFFEVDKAIERLLPQDTLNGDWVEFGCGYGTFTLPASQRITGTLKALDIEPDMIHRINQLSAEHCLNNIEAEKRDFVQFGTGLSDQTQSGAMIYNLLHLDDPVDLLREAYRTLKVGGCLSVIHWRGDIPTPRGPALEIRPSPEQCCEWIEAAGFKHIQAIDLADCCPYHFGLLAWR